MRGDVAATRTLKARLHRKVRALLEVPKDHGRGFRIVWALGGVLLVLAGLAMTVLPGPAIVVVPVGLAMLAGVFAWARKLVSVSINVGVDVQRWVKDLRLRVKVLAVLIGVCLTAAVATLLLR